jgi:hypothetical protein
VIYGNEIVLNKRRGILDHLGYYAILKVFVARCSMLLISHATLFGTEFDNRFYYVCRLVCASYCKNMDMFMSSLALDYQFFFTF